MKPSTTFANWIRSNSGRLAKESEDFQHTVATTSLTLEMIEMNEEMGQAATEYAIQLFKKFEADVKERGWDMPDIDLPKIKVVKPVAKSGGYQR